MYIFDTAWNRLLQLKKKKISDVCRRKMKENVEGSMTGRFANVLRRSTKKRNQRCACICLVPLNHDTKRMRYTCIYLVLLATDQAKAVRELTQHVRETTSKGSEQYAAETTCRRKDRRPKGHLPT